MYFGTPLKIHPFPQLDRRLKRKKGEDVGHLLPLESALPQLYGTEKGRIPSVGNNPVGPAAVEGCERNRKRIVKPAETLL